MKFLVLIAAAIGAGVLNTVAGAGTFLTVTLSLNRVILNLCVTV
jgi:hypothetical protein